MLYFKRSFLFVVFFFSSSFIPFENAELVWLEENFVPLKAEGQSRFRAAGCIIA